MRSAKGVVGMHPVGILRSHDVHLEFFCSLFFGCSVANRSQRIGMWWFPSKVLFFSKRR
jgi:hypothetical protein